MTELPLVFLGGLLGSSHCIGMCGPLALALGTSQVGFRRSILRQLTFSIGRVCTYGFGGALAALSGWWLAQRPLAVINIQATLSIIAGTALVMLGLTTAGVVPNFLGRWLAPQSCGAAKWLKTLLIGPSLSSALAAGVFTGFIPCGLVYAFLAYAASTANVVHGWLTMTVFGLGTVPLMVLAGSGGSLLSLSVRARTLRVAAWCVVVTGIISVARGAGYLEWFAGASPGECPFCR